MTFVVVCYLIKTLKTINVYKKKYFHKKYFFFIISVLKWNSYIHEYILHGQKKVNIFLKISNKFIIILIIVIYKKIIYYKQIYLNL